MKGFMTALCVFTIVATALVRPAQASDKSGPALSGAVAYGEADCVCKVCVPEPAKTKTVKTVYDVKCVDYCLPKCPHFGWLKGDCGECGTTCDKPRTRRVLVKKLITEEHDTIKCVPKQIGANP
jgi:hypothetical protein